HTLESRQRSHTPDVRASAAARGDGGANNDLPPGIDAATGRQLAAPKFPAFQLAREYRAGKGPLRAPDPGKRLSAGGTAAFAEGGRRGQFSHPTGQHHGWKHFCHGVLRKSSLNDKKSRNTAI